MERWKERIIKEFANKGWTVDKDDEKTLGFILNGDSYIEFDKQDKSFVCIQDK